MNLVLFDDALEHLTRIHRVIRMDQGHALLVGVGGSGKQSLCKLASYTAGCEVFEIQLSRGYSESSFRDDLKILYNKLGTENKKMVFLFTDQHVAEEGGSFFCYPPTKSEGYSFGVVRASVRPSTGGAVAKIKLFQNMVMLHIKLKLTTLAAKREQIFCPQTHPRPRGWGQKVKLYIFSESSHVAYQIKAEDAGSNMVANILPTDTPSTQGVGSKGQTISFSESSHVAYQIKADDAGSNMGTNILLTDTPSTQGVGSKGQTISFSESSHVAYQIKADDTGSNMVANFLPTDTPLTQGMGSKGQTISFTESSHVAYQIKGN